MTCTWLDRLVTRRSFGKGALAVGGAVAGVTTLGGAFGAGTSLFSPRAAEADITDADILNFALNLEYLEAEFYTVVTTGQTIDQLGIGIDGTGAQGPTTGGMQVQFDDSVGAILAEIAYDEQQHVLLLRNALGDARIAKPAIDLNALAGVCDCDYDGSRDVLRLARAFEDVGVSAYSGAAPLIADKNVLAVAAQILGTEALHSGNIRLLAAAQGIDTFAVDGKDILPPPSGTQYFTVNPQALAVVRTTSEVLAIVYGNATPGTSAGGFFPAGVNGAINAV